MIGGSQMKQLYIIGGTMGIGKTAICQELKKKLPNCAFLDGDWCWDMHPFLVNDETKQMVMQNICFLLNQFIHCSVYENIIFCWVLHEQAIIDEIVSNLDTTDCHITTISLICDETTLKNRLQKDIDNNIRQQDIIERSVQRIPLYRQLATTKIDTTNLSIQEVCQEILQLKENL